MPKACHEPFRVERDEPVEKPEHEARRGEGRSHEEQPCDPPARRLASCPQRHAGPIAEKRWLLRLQLVHVPDVRPKTKRQGQCIQEKSAATSGSKTSR